MWIDADPFQVSLMSDRAVRILIITVDYPPIEGGISTLALNVARECALANCEVTVLAPHIAGCESFDAGESTRIVRFGGYAMGWFRLFPLLAASRKLIPHNDLVIGINVAYGGVVGLFARSFFGVPYAVLAYGYEFLKFQNVWPMAPMLRYIYAQARGVIAISKFTRDQLVKFGVPESRIAPILPGATPDPVADPAIKDLMRLRYPIDGNRVVLCVGRMIPRKGHLTLVRAWPRVLKQVKNAHLLVVGQGPEVSACSRAAQNMGVRDRITFAGKLGDAEVQALYSLCDVFALPSGTSPGGHVEGFGLVFAEAHAHGKPVIAGTSGGTPEAVTHDETGLLVPPDDRDALADAIVQVLNDADFAKRLGENGRRRVERELNWRKFTSQMLHVLGVKR
ncbi:MAG TPA: glycosyltransferase family 4 protein [Candidatus Hydrogenedentes bacterium]|nr:glycosyltransferase family 4 protein [Candidatus Hydrogenedentota bacterium]HRK32955.1 glycosyltransferase family 4 protein [Candidatus Hydrogenedentota bacterium]